MNYRQLLLNCVLLFFVIYSCRNKDEEERLFPKVKTLEVSNITDEGAVFNGLIEGVLSYKNITDHGFCYGFPDKKAPLGYTKISLGKPDESTNSFHAQVSRDLLKDQTYTVIAYIEISNGKIYGTASSFISKGGLGPEIKSFKPQVAGWGDTIKITGKNFSDNVNNNTVKFDQVKATIVSANDSVLRVIVPEQLLTQKSMIGVTTAEKTFLSMQPFLIGKPVIKTLAAKVPFGGTLNVKTQNVNGKVANFYIDGTLITSTQVSLNEYNLVVPKTYNYGSHTLKITLFGENAEGSFHYDAPYISDFSPKQVGWNDKLTIIGKNFKSLPSKSGIDFLGSNCGTSNFSVLNDSVIQLNIPVCVTVPQCKVGIFTDYFKLYSSQQLSINGPKLQPFSNNQFCAGDHIVLEGKQIYSYGTLHCFDGICEDVAPSFIDSTHLEFDLPVTLSVGIHKLTLKIGQLQSNPIEFNIKKLTVNSIVEDFSCRYGKITLLGENFARLSYQNVVKIGGVQAEVVSKNEKSIQVRLPVSNAVNSNSEIIVSVGQQQVIVPYKVEIIEPWEKVSEFGAGFFAGAKFTIGNKFYFSTGSMDNGEFYCYNSDNNTWKKIADYPGGRVMVPICFVIGQYAYVGLGNKTSPQKFWKYDSVSDRWDEIAECPLNVSSVGWDENKNMGFAFVNGQYGYVGNTSGGMYKYDSVNNRWISCKWHDVHYLVSVNVGINNNTTCFHVCGSSDSVYGSNIFLNEYNPISDSWKFSEYTFYFFTKDMYGSTYIEKLNRFLFDGYIMHSTRPSGIQFFDFSLNKKGFFFPSISPGATLFSTEEGRLFSMIFDENLNKLMLYKFNFDKYKQVKTLIDDY